MDPTDEGCFSISAQSDLSKLLKRSKLLVVDEATLIDRRNFDKFEATLRDITGCSLPWGGKIVIFCGDQDNILADEQHKQFLYLGVWAPWITILSMEY